MGRVQSGLVVILDKQLHQFPGETPEVEVIFQISTVVEFACVLEISLNQLRCPWLVGVVTLGSRDSDR